MERAMTERSNRGTPNGADPDRRRVLQCMSWAGAGVLWTVSGGGPRPPGLMGEASAAQAKPGLHFVQISDSHIGFKLAPNPDPAATLGEAIAKIKAMPVEP